MVRPSSVSFRCAVCGNSTSRYSIPCLPAEVQPPSSLQYPAVDPRCENRSIWQWALPHRETAAFYIELGLERTNRRTIKQEVGAYSPKARVSLKSSHGRFLLPVPFLTSLWNPCGIKTITSTFRHYRQRERGCGCLRVKKGLNQCVSVYGNL